MTYTDEIAVIIGGKSDFKLKRLKAVSERCFSAVIHCIGHACFSSLQRLVTTFHRNRQVNEEESAREQIGAAIGNDTTLLLVTGGTIGQMARLFRKWFVIIFLYLSPMGAEGTHQISCWGQKI